jgi:nucleoside-diphosphate-sugar epimerase
VLVPVLRGSGHDVTTFDRLDSPDPAHLSGDLRDLELVRQATEPAEAIVHLGGLAGDYPGQDAEVLDINVRGTWNVLHAARQAGIRRIVYFSSINALGCVGGHGRPSYLPVDDEHPARPVSTYQLSKYLSEETCRTFTRGPDPMTIVCLRPVLVAEPERHYPQWTQQSSVSREGMYESELYAYIDVRDVAEAALCALTAPIIGFEAILLTAPDTLADRTSAELLSHEFSDLTWRGDSTVLHRDPYSSLIDGGRAERLIGFVARHRWREPAP